jgi:hypothetical protein
MLCFCGLKLTGHKEQNWENRRHLLVLDDNMVCVFTEEKIEWLSKSKLQMAQRTLDSSSMTQRK